MHIVVLATAASSGGALTILESLREYAEQDSDDHTWEFLVSGDQIEPGQGVGVTKLEWPKRSWAHRLWFEISGRFILDRFGPDTVISLQNTLPFGCSDATILYIHQPLPFDPTLYFKFRRGEYRLAIYQRLIGRLICSSARRASAVVVQTEWMKAAVAQRARIPSGKIGVFPPGIRIPTELVSVKGPVDPAAFFYPTSAAAYKNIACLVAAADVLQQRGIVHGTIAVTVTGLDLGPRISQVGRLSREHTLRRLSESVLVFPSKMETYGLPLAEARLLGVIVLAADRPYAREVLDSYPNAYFFDPDEPAELAALMAQVAQGDIVPVPVPETPMRQDSWADMLDFGETLVARGTTGRTQ